MHRYRCVDIVTPETEKRPVWVEAEKPVPLKNVAPYEGRGRASGATGYRCEWTRGGRFPVFGRMFYTARGKGALGGVPMNRIIVAAVDEVDELIEQYYRAQREFLRGNPEPVKNLFSHREDVTSLTPMVLPCVGGMRSPRP